jgi:pantoate--beta-alanine ligase
MFKNNIVSSSKELKAMLSKFRDQQFSIGFVPTMGALHNGHLSLLDTALSQNDFAVISIFVNPTQFNSNEDLENYPRTLESDLLLLYDKENCIVFLPEMEDIYPQNDSFIPMDLQGLDDILEGKYRVGHFNGVVHVVHNLFQIVAANRAYFGLKDFQQLVIIKKMVAHFNIPIEIIACTTLRETSGLAMSSRNSRLKKKELASAQIIHKTLLFVAENKSKMNPLSLKIAAKEFFKSSSLKLEYLEIVDEKTLKTAMDWKTKKVCLIAAYCNNVRLIDNIIL